MPLEPVDTAYDRAGIEEKTEETARTSLQFANELIHLEPSISHLKLQKITYAAYGWHFVVFEGMGRLFDEEVQAWDFGPVFPNLYRHLRYCEFQRESPFFGLPVQDVDHLELPAPRLDYSGRDAYLEPFVKWVSERYFSFTGIELVGLTHREGSPWSKVKERFPSRRIELGTSISDDDIIEEFKYLKRPQS